MAGVEKVIWEHARRNFALLEDGVQSIVCPVNDGSSLSGLESSILVHHNICFEKETEKDRITAPI